MDEKRDRYRELNTLVHGTLEPVGVGWRRRENAMSLCLLNVVFGGFLDLIQGRGGGMSGRGRLA